MLFHQYCKEGSLAVRNWSIFIDLFIKGLYIVESGGENKRKKYTHHCGHTTDEWFGVFSVRIPRCPQTMLDASRIGVLLNYNVISTYCQRMSTFAQNPESIRRQKKTNEEGYWDAASWAPTAMGSWWVCVRHQEVIIELGRTRPMTGARWLEQKRSTAGVYWFCRLEALLNPAGFGHLQQITSDR